MEQGELTFGEIATQYARDVVEGRIPSCRWHRLACERHLKDLARAGTEAFPYLFNPELTNLAGRTYRPAERVCTFAQLMPHIKGDWAARGLRIHLEPWQIFILASIFGWVHMITFKRRFRAADLFVPRKNAKSTLAAVIGLAMLAIDDEFGAEVYSGATSENQAMEVFRPALLMARMTPKFLQRYNVSANASNLAIVEKNAKFEPVIGKPGDGASPSCAIVDEYHEHKTPDLYDTMKTGMMARSQPLLLVITTAGSDIGGPCYMHQVELQKILEGTVENEQRFGIVFTIDERDDWTTEAALIKANPNYGISIMRDVILGDLRDAITDPRKQNTFKTKHLNVWVAAASPWLNLYNLQQSGDPSLTIESFAGQECVVGLDLASKQDIASCVFLFKTPGWNGAAGEQAKFGTHQGVPCILDHYTAISRNYVPQAAVDKPENAHYQAWVNAGHLIVTPGNMIDLEMIQEDILSAAGTVLVREIVKDQWGGQQLGANLALEGFEVVDLPQQTRYLSEPMKDLQALVDAGRFHHDGNPCYVWQMSNVEVAPDRNENIFPRKLRAQNKIDAAVGTILAHARSMVPREEEAAVELTIL